MSTIVFPDRAASARHARVELSLARAAAAARKAPTLGPLRPWRWEIAGDRAGLHLVSGASEDRAEQVVACGSGLHHALTALAGEGVRVHVDHLPPTAEPGLLATVTVTGVGAPAPADVRAHQAISLRATAATLSRRAPRPAATFAQLEVAAAAVGARLRLDGRPSGLAHIEAEPDNSQGWLRAGEALSAVTLAAVQQQLAAKPDGWVDRDGFRVTIGVRFAVPGDRPIMPGTEPC